MGASSEEDEWVEVPKKSTKPAVKDTSRDWMLQENDTVRDLFKTKDRDRKLNEIKREEEEKRKETIRKEREIKPVETKAGRKYEWGDKGSSWRMMKLKRVFDTAKEEGLSVEQVALDRYGDMEEFQEALDEKEFLDSKRSERSSQSTVSNTSSSFRAPIRPSLFRAPNAAESKKRPHKEIEEKKPVSIPKASAPKTVKLVAVEPVLTTDQLNKLYSKVVKARIMKSPNLEELEEEYEYEKKRSETQQDVMISSSYVIR
jgi:hypothetical protein